MDDTHRSSGIATCINTVLPPELVDRTLDYLHDDKTSLMICSLVCKHWHHTGRFHLFRQMKLGSWIFIWDLSTAGHYDKFPDYLSRFTQEASHLCVNTEAITVSGGVSGIDMGEFTLDMLDVILKCAPCLQSLTLSNVELRAGGSNAQMSHVYPSVRDLVLDECGVNSGKVLSALFCLLPSIRHFYLFHLRFLTPYDQLFEALPPHVALESFTGRVDSIASLLLFFRDTCTAGSLRCLDLGVMSDLQEVLGMRHFDPLVMQNVLSLRVGLSTVISSHENGKFVIYYAKDYLESFWEAMPLQHFTSLIEFTLAIDFRLTMHHIRVFDSISATVRNIRIDVGQIVFFDDIGSEIWDLLDQLPSRFTHLESVKFHHLEIKFSGAAHCLTLPEKTSALQEHMPNLVSNGLLYVT